MKNVNVYIPKGKQVFYANFRFKGSQINRSTGSPDQRTAQRIANQMRNKALEGAFDTLPRLRDDGATCQAVIERYLAKSQVRNKREVTRDFLTVVGEGVAVQRDDAHGLRLSALTADAAIRFRDGGERSATTTNALLRSARSVFSARAYEWYRDLHIPTCVEEWRKVAFLRESTDKSFRAIPQEVLAKMDSETSIMLVEADKMDNRLANEWRNAWAAYCLMRLCGLRNSEVEALGWHWFEKRSDGTILINIIERQDFKPKASSGQVPCSSKLFDALVRELGCSREHVLAGTLTDRHRGVNHRLNEFVRKYLPDRPKAAYELRKQYGAEMAARYGIETAAKLLRHKGIKTAWEHYYDSLKLNSVQPLEIG